MVARNPLVVIAGQVQELPSGDTVTGGGSGPGIFSTKNAIINGGMQVAQRGVLTLGSSAPAANAGYGKVDRFQAWATGTAVSAGTADQDTASIGRTGYALKLAGVTLTGTGIVYIRHRIEGINALRFKNQTATFSIHVKHDVGSTINYTVTVRKPTALDNYTSTTVIQTGSATAVATGTETSLTLSSISMGDCSYGLEIEIKAECGAITTKNFWYAEAQLEEGVSATTFEYVSFDQELVRCLRYYETNVTYGTVAGNGVGDNRHVFTNYVAANSFCHIPFKAQKRAGASVVFYRCSVSATDGAWAVYNGAGWTVATIDGPYQISTVGFDQVLYWTSTQYYSSLVSGNWTASAEL